MLARELEEAQSAAAEAYRDLQNASRLAVLGKSPNGKPVTLDEVREWAAAEQAMVLAYLVGNQQSFAVAISGTGDPLIERLTLSDSQAQELNESTGPVTSDVLFRLLNSESGGLLRSLKSNAAPSQWQRRLSLLSAILLPDQIRTLVVDSHFKRLVVLPDGALTMMPLEALTAGSTDENSYLLDVAPPMVYAPSFTVLKQLLKRQAASPITNRDDILSVSDPAYDTAGADTNSVLANASRDYGSLGGQLTRLPYTATESTWLAEVFTKNGRKVLKLSGAKATEANVKLEMTGSKVLHFACHGLTDQSHGNLFGALALTPGRDHSRADDDGFLTLSEIYRLDLRSCELAMLSACDTNFGPQQRGEGTWALSRGFLVAGSRRVAASNWLVDDEAAASLVSYFAGGVASDLGKSAQPDYAKRLYDAKRWVRQQSKWSNPYFWGGFVLVGPN